MAIAPTDIKFFQSTGGLGGVKTATEITSGQLNNLFDNVSGAESAAGSVEYRCFYVENTNVTDTLSVAEIWIQSNTPSPGTDVAIGLDPAGLGGTATTIANETTAPAGVTFTQPSASPGLALGNLAPGGFHAVWVRRTVTAGAAAFNNDGVTLRVSGDSPA